MSPVEVYRPAFSGTAASKTAFTGEVTSLSSPDVTYGLPFTEACAKHVKETFKRSRVYIICSGSLSRNTNELEKLIDALGKEHVVGVRKGMVSHTLWSEIIQITNEARAAKADCLVTLGGGSLTDGAKIVGLALANDVSTTEQLAEYSVEAPVLKPNIKLPTITLICIPTSLSGGEYFSLGGGTDDSTRFKHAFLHPGMGAKLVILDAQLATLTPAVHWLSTGMRSIDHCVEGLCSLESQPKSDAGCEAGLRLLIPWLLKTKADESDVEARHQAQMGALFAMTPIRDGVPLGGSHGIGHQLGPLGVPHGVTSCIMNPAVMKYNLRHGTGEPEIAKKQAKVRAILWSEPDIAAVLTEAGLKEETADLGDCMDKIIRALGLPRSLKEVGIDRSHIDRLAKRTLDDAWAPTNPVPLLEASQVKEILEAVAE